MATKQALASPRAQRRRKGTYYIEYDRDFLPSLETNEGGIAVNCSEPTPATADLSKRLRALSNDELILQTQRLAHRERATTIAILHHLNEIERRRLFLDLGYSSLFDYCVRRLKYSPSAAGRRIQAARCMVRHPRVLELLRTRELSLAAVSLIAPILAGAKRDSIIERVRGRSYREVERLVSEYRPPVAFRDRVRPVRVVVSKTEPLPAPGVAGCAEANEPVKSPAAQSPRVSRQRLLPSWLPNPGCCFSSWRPNRA